MRVAGSEMGGPLSARNGHVGKLLSREKKKKEKERQKKSSITEKMLDWLGKGSPARDRVTCLSYY